MKKFVFVVFSMLLLASIATASMLIPASDRAKEVAKALEYSPVISLDDGELKLLPQAYYVQSDNAVLKGLFGVKHVFAGSFSAELSDKQLKFAKVLGVEVTPVQIYTIAVKPVCGDGFCQGNEPRSCPEDCSGTPDPDPEPEPEPEQRACLPDDKIPWGISMVNGGSGGEGVTVAVLDTGVMTSHLDLVGSITKCVSKVTHFSPDKRSCEDAHGHGTHVSGSVLADGGADGLGVFGVAPDASLIAVKVCDRRGYCYGDDISAGIYYAVDNGANIISMSIGGDSPDYQVLAAIDHATDNEVLVVAAAGNDGPADGSIDYSGAYVKAVAVGALDISEQVPSWSSRGINDGDSIIEEREVELAAPGVSVLSTYNDGCYAYMSGTSMATPHVSGLAAKVWNVAGGDATLVRAYLHEIAKDVWTDGEDTATGFGLPVA